MTIDPDSMRGRIIYAHRANPWALLWGRLALWTGLSLLAGLTPVSFSDAPVWIWPLALVACVLMAGQTIGVMRGKRGSEGERG